MKRISVFNQKGGCGKTTTVYNLAGSLAKRGYKVLVVDCDPQFNITKTLHLEKGRIMDDIIYTISDLMQEQVSINEVIQTALLRTRGNAKPKNLGIDYVPSDRRLSSVNLNDGEIMKRAMDSIDTDYDFVLFDCPPGLSDIIINALVASDYVLVPVAADKDSLEGFDELLETVQVICNNKINPDLKLLGVFMTLVSGRDSFDQYLYSNCMESLGDGFIRTSIRRQSNAKRSPFFGRPLCWFAPTSGVAQDYERLTDTILERLA